MTIPGKITCPVCGHQFTPNQQACDGCPLHQGCDLICCPSCGHTTIDPSKSKLVNLSRKIKELWNKALLPEKTD